VRVVTCEVETDGVFVVDRESFVDCIIKGASLLAWEGGQCTLQANGDFVRVSLSSAVD